MATQLTPDEETALVTRARAGDRGAVDTLLRAHEGLVRRWARLYQHMGVDAPDLANEGRERLADVAVSHHWQPGRGTRWSTYAVTAMKRRMIAVILEQGMLVAREKEEQRASVRDDADPALRAALRRCRETVSLDAGTGEGAALVSRLSAGGERADDRIERRQWARSVGQAVGQLCAADRRVARMRIMVAVEGGEVPTLEVCGAALGVTRERVRQIEVRAGKRIRAALARAEVAC